MVFSLKLADQYRELKSAAADCLLLMQACQGVAWRRLMGTFMQVMDDDARAVAAVTGLKLQRAGDSSDSSTEPSFAFATLVATAGRCKISAKADPPQADHALGRPASGGKNADLPAMLRIAL